MTKFWAVGLGVIFSINVVRAAVYNGNGISAPGDGGLGGAVGTGSLSLTDNGTTVSGTFTKGSGSFSDVLVIFIDSKTCGFSSTSGFTDAGSSLRKAISGWDGSSRAIAEFANGFSADYAIALKPFGSSGFDGLFQLVNGGTHTSLGSVNLSPTGTGTSGTYTFSF